MKRLSLQWRMTLLTALLIACACICLNLLLYRSGATGMDSLGGYIMQYQPGDVEGLAIEIPDDQISDFLIHFSQEVCDAKALYDYKGWIITSVVTLLSAAIAYFVTGSALKPLGQFSRQAEKINQEQRGFLHIPDFFRRIIVVGDNIKVRRDENGITTIGFRNFLLDENSLRL